MPLTEAISGLGSNQLFRVFVMHMKERREKRMMAAIKSADPSQSETLRGRAQEMIDLMELLEK